ncbi:Retrovirus-related Pol polyprotein from transposon 297 family [Cucumis melo var. makuwa]|uniref:Retrovirus-related Pol polyprotein from transposon 297 family n=1 Tax=Cucumis melo var. makuwa TaxID=1194695 RepID=A0A5A7STP2_CUCMM|nr:Retrovirus-related Pol polyprotein from transposon 297 family [Cucumis melo var. makuwa]TYK01257.1 Retrovirus-related Pol polyprotein from transposon 297 family [Cucumis melo var. makuwa]
MGLTGYYMRFVHHYGTMAAPLTQLLKVGAFKWSEEAEEAFVGLKNAMMTLSVLPLPDFNLPFEIETDASGYDIGAVLIQAKRPIAYYSYPLAMRDRAKLVYERELMVVVVIQPQYQKWITKLLGYSFEVVYKPRSENKATDALLRMPPTVHLYNLSAPTMIDLKVIKEEPEKDIRVLKNVQEADKRTLLGRDETRRLLLPLEIPKQIWSGISMDFVEGLPKASGFEVILVVVDRLSKHAHFLALKHPFTAKSMVELFVKVVVRLHGYPNSIVSDRDKVFLSNFWKEMFRLAGTE